MILSTVERIVVQAIDSYNHKPDFEDILSAIFKIRHREMNAPVLSSALHALWKRGLVTNDIDACIKRYWLTEDGKKFINQEKT